MKIGDQVEGGIYAGAINCHHIIYSPIEYDLPYKVNWYQASDYCKEVGMVLPTMGELNLLYDLHKLAPEYFLKRPHHWYWSSAESSSAYSWGQNFVTGNQFKFSKTSNCHVRAIKRIKI